MADAASEIRKLQRLRSRPPRDLSISNMIESIQSQATQTQKKLGELIGDLYLAETDRKRDRLWRSVAKALAGAGVEEKLLQAIVGERSLEGLAEAVAKLF